MNISILNEKIPDFARDIRLNLETILTEDGAPGLTPTQIWGTALACAWARDSSVLVEALRESAGPVADDATIFAAKASAAIMAMNNVYYRSTHLLEDTNLQKTPAKLRMSVIGKPGVPKLDFELMCFAVSAISGCGQCLKSHKIELEKAGLDLIGIQSALRIAAVVTAADQSLRIAAESY